MNLKFWISEFIMASGHEDKGLEVPAHAERKTSRSTGSPMNPAPGKLIGALGGLSAAPLDLYKE